MLSYRYKKHTDNIPADVHYIQWIFVETENGGQIHYLNPGQAPNAVFELGSEKPVAVYAYGNLPVAFG